MTTHCSGMSYNPEYCDISIPGKDGEQQIRVDEAGSNHEQPRFDVFNELGFSDEL